MVTKDRQTGYPSIDKPWLNFYEKPLNGSDIPACNAYHFMYEQNREYHDNIALKYFNRSIKYSELFEKIQNVAASLKTLGINKGDIVTLQVLNMPQTVIMFYALSYIGAVANIVFITDGEKELHNALLETESVMYVTIDSLYEKQKNALIETNVKWVLLLSVADEADFVTKAIVSLKRTKINIAGRIKWSDLCRPSNTIVDEVNDAQIPVVMVHTSGTTGKSKMVVLSNRNMNALAMQYAYAYSQIDYERGQIFMNALPPFIAFGIVCALHMPLCLGLTEALILDPTPNNQDKYFVKYKPNFYVQGMLAIEKIINNKKIKKMDLNFVSVFAVGGEAIPKEFEKRVNKFLEEHNSKAQLSIGYGMTEVAATVVTSNPYVNKPGTVGIPLPGTIIKIVEPETTNELMYGEVGEICFNSPTMMIGYYRQEEETKHIIRCHSDGLTWVHSGDLGRIDEEGFLTVVGRIKRIIEVRKDGIYHKIFPQTIEDVFSKVPGVAAVSIVGRKKCEIINELVAFIVDETGGRNDALNDKLKEIAQCQLESWEQPVEYRFIESLPRTQIGKVDFKKLEDIVNH